MAYRILLVDDSAVTRMVLKKTIGMTSIPVESILEAANGKEALDLLCDQKVDLILADINMPEMNGMEMAAVVLANPSTRDIPIVIISTHSEDIRIHQLRQQGVRDYIHKPFTPESIRNVLEKVLLVAPAAH